MGNTEVNMILFSACDSLQYQTVIIKNVPNFAVVGFAVKCISRRIQLSDMIIVILFHYFVNI